MDRFRPAVIASLVFLAAAYACAGTPRGPGDPVRYDRLTREEILSLNVRNLYDAVEQLRPRWLYTTEGPRSFQMDTRILVYQGQAFLGDVQILREMGLDAVYEMRWLDGPTASATLPGISGHVAGAIVIRVSPDYRPNG